MSKTTCNIIGCGRLGKTIGRLLTLKAGIEILGVCNRSLHSSANAVSFIGQGTAVADIAELPSADFVLIAASDEQIAECVQELLRSPNLRPGTVVAHCGGAISSQILAPLRDKGSSVASFHPMHSFADPALSVAHFGGTYCALEGDEQAAALLQEILFKLGGVVSRIHPEMKALYHAGGVMASNYLVALFDKSVHCLMASGASQEAATSIAQSLMTNSLQNLKETGSSAAALTGPIKRGESEVVAMHLRAMPNHTIDTVYRALGLATCDIAGLAKGAREKIETVLTRAERPE